MSIEEIKSGIAALSPEQRTEVSAFLFQLQLTSDPDYRERVESRLADKDPAHWLTLEEFEQRLEER